MTTVLSVLGALLQAGFAGFRLQGSNGPGGGSFWMPKPASTVAGEVDFVFYAVYWISLAFFVLIVALMVYFVFRFRRRPDRGPESSTTHNTPLEVTWTIIPLLLVIWIFYIGFKGYLNLRTPPGNSYPIQVTGRTWVWNFTYPNGYVDNVLHVPVSRPVLLTMTSEDMIHSFFVPAFRVKMDVVPGRYTTAWFEATEPGSYDLFCTEYCGTGHSDMRTQVVVHEAGMFEKWLTEASDFLAVMSPEDGGKRLYEVRGCKQCHSVDGAGGIGPTFKNAWGRQEVTTAGERVVVDENYIRESILQPQAKIVAGFEPVMPTYQGRLKDKEITAIIAYIRSLKTE